MKKTLLFALATMVSVNSAIAVENKSKFNWFAGGSAAISNITWDDDVVDFLDPIEISETNFSLGAEIGGKFGDYNNIYNFGLTINYDYLFDSNANIPAPYSSVILKITTGFSALSASFDNYIRIDSTNNKRSDLVFGLGFARITERVFIKDTSDYYSDDDSGGAMVLKLGINSELTNYLDWNINLRAFIPTNSDSDVDLLTNISVGLKFKF